MLTEYQLIVSTNTWLWGAQVMKNLTYLQQPLSSVPKVAIVERFNCIQKFPENLKLSCILIYVALLSPEFLISFSGRREQQRFVLNRVRADLQGWGDVQNWPEQ